MTYGIINGVRVSKEEAHKYVITADKAVRILNTRKVPKVEKVEKAERREP